MLEEVQHSQEILPTSSQAALLIRGKSVGPHTGLVCVPSGWLLKLLGSGWRPGLNLGCFSYSSQGCEFCSRCRPWCSGSCRPSLCGPDNTSQGCVFSMDGYGNYSLAPVMFVLREHSPQKMPLPPPFHTNNLKAQTCG